jgi:hypothetical protein
MSESPNKAWYQDGFAMFWLVVFAIVIYVHFLKSKEEPAYVQVAGQVRQPLFGTDHFELSVWHQFSGDLRKGRLSISVQGQTIPSAKDFKIHSFVVWQPNRASAVSFQFPLENYDPGKPLVFNCLVQAENASSTTSKFVWQYDGWKQ